MEDLSALAARIAASVGALRGCLILSRDGLVLGSFPNTDGALAKPAWLRFAALGEPDKGFLQFGSEVWCYARRGPYAAFAVAGGSVRPSLVMDQMEIALVQAEESRAKVGPLRVPEPPAASLSKPRAPLHPEEQKGASPRTGWKMMGRSTGSCSLRSSLACFRSAEEVTKLEAPSDRRA